MLKFFVEIMIDWKTHDVKHFISKGFLINSCECWLARSLCLFRCAKKRTRDLLESF